jgi:branched-chain amino acid transport system ATP-binding protein
MLERTSSDPVLRLEGLRKNFGSLTVTDDVTLDIMPGEMHAIIGPNGAGKTTLINQISGIIPPDGGRIVFGGNDVTALPPDARALSGRRAAFRSLRFFPAFRFWKMSRWRCRRATARASASSAEPPMKRCSMPRR